MNVAAWQIFKFTLINCWSAPKFLHDFFFYLRSRSRLNAVLEVQAAECTNIKIIQLSRLQEKSEKFLSKYNQTRLRLVWKNLWKKMVFWMLQKLKFGYLCNATWQPWKRSIIEKFNKKITKKRNLKELPLLRAFLIICRIFTIVKLKTKRNTDKLASSQMHP